MSYLSDKARELHTLLAELGVERRQTIEKIAEHYKEALLESYRNGQTTRRNGNGAPSKQGKRARISKD